MTDEIKNEFASHGQDADINRGKRKNKRRRRGKAASMQAWNQSASGVVGPQRQKKKVACSNHGKMSVD